MQTITPEQLKERLSKGETIQMIDVREAEEVAAGMIPGAKHIPLGELPDRVNEIEQTGETVLICRSGGRSGKAYDYLTAIGRTGLKNMTGGMLAWDKL
ncbi:rhodanese-like domain-containing protein [Paenibacillus turpanensis]|uniref:rhodanese-like domain-containing protein n=1 Tax=Paenibacillus turpanensis TaxID=2689078 RepID=UPI001407E585|nr:rhodanese-like domain-containing protein [Paenibacillus turpanensis]